MYPTVEDFEIAHRKLERVIPSAAQKAKDNEHTKDEFRPVAGSEPAEAATA